MTNGSAISGGGIANAGDLSDRLIAGRREHAPADRGGGISDGTAATAELSETTVAFNNRPERRRRDLRRRRRRDCDDRCRSTIARNTRRRHRRSAAARQRGDHRLAARRQQRRQLLVHGDSRSTGAPTSTTAPRARSTTRAARSTSTRPQRGAGQCGRPHRRPHVPPTQPGRRHGRPVLLLLRPARLPADHGVRAAAVRRGRVRAVGDRAGSADDRVRAVGPDDRDVGVVRVPRRGDGAALRVPARRPGSPAAISRARRR